MNDHNLDDLIIDDIEPQQNQKAKSFLTIIALAIVVLIVAIIFTKILLKTPEQEQLTFEQDETEMISPDLTLQSAPEPEEKKSETIESPKEEELPEPLKDALMPVKEEMPSPEENVVPEKSMVEKVSESVEKLVEEPAVALEQNDQEAIPAAVSEPVNEEKPEEQTSSVEEPAQFSSKPITEPNTKKVTKPETKKAPEAIIERAKERPRPRPVNVITRPGANPGVQLSSDGVYYIQVGAFSTSPSKRFLSKIKSSGFQYVITKPSRSGLKKLLIGPYNNRITAENALLEVKDRINKNAFLHKEK